MLIGNMFSNMWAVKLPQSSLERGTTIEAVALGSMPLFFGTALHVYTSLFAVPV